ncbi:hypothetical protein AK88_02729 [Plasmodium fragile]|uniref:Uncharacterized protein n=1 Tax=Plasmodium fragile TaxID=5857 RepID=A0A0D9QKR1_PLAFR|nr:uncharacterized protein AK88_02729 [Plasmodium fragile]KJP87563.1 hypothetical protein AK88_02729 [Plasmodium fragile]
MNEIIDKKKSDTYNKIKLIIKDVYEGNLKNVLEEMSLNVDKPITHMLNVNSDAKEDILKIQFGDINEKLTNSLGEHKNACDKLKARISLLSYVNVPDKYNIINGEANKKYNELIKEIDDKDIDTKLQ